LTILLLNQTFYPDVASTAQYLSDLALELVRRGHDVTVVCGRRAYDTPGERYPRREVWRGVKIRRISGLSLGKKTRWRRAMDFGSYVVNCVLHLARLPRFDLVVALTSPPLISWLGAQFVRVKGGRLLFWVMDLNPDEAIAAGWLRPGSRTTNCLAVMLRYSLDRATTVVVLDRFMAKRIADKGIDPGKIVVLPPWSQDNDIAYNDSGRQRFRSAHGLQGKFVVMYSGNHSPCHPLQTLLEAARRLKSRHNLAFCFVGGGSQFETVRSFASDNHLDNIVTVPYQPLSALSASLSAADLHVVVMGNPYVGIVHPCKVYNIRAIGIPYLYIGPADSHVQELDPTFSARHEDVDTVRRHIEAAAKLGPSRLEAPAEAANHGRQQLIAKMVAALEYTAAGITVGESNRSTSEPGMERPFSERRTQFRATR
jgi:glycosyltransferase involved in cell wall biosynthesis